MLWALVLEGGGAKGAYQVGAIKALKELGFEFGCVTGTSIGAVNGAMFAQGDFNNTYELWKNIEVAKVLDFEEKYVKNIYELNLDKDTIKYLLKKIGQTIKEKGLDTSKMRDLVDRYVDEEKLRSSDIEFGFITVDLTHMKVLKLYKEDVPKGKICDYVMASGMLPLFKNKEGSKDKFFDGGIYDNLPISMAVDKGYKKIIAIRNRPNAKPKKIKDKNVEVTYIIPTTKPGGILNFTNDSVNSAINMGYLDTMRLFKKYLGNLYYIVDVDEIYAKTIVDNLPYTFFEKLAKILSVNLNLDDNLKNMEFLTLALEKEFNIKHKFEREVAFIDALIVSVEQILNFSNVYRFKEYSLLNYFGLFENIDCNLTLKNTKKKKPYKIISVSIAELIMEYFRI